RGASGQDGYARLMAEYDRLMTEQSFAEKTYLAAQSALDAAEAAARSQSYYLAAYQTPMLAQTAEYPRRLLLTGLVALFGFLIWSVLALIYYSLRDRR
ncbi:MAG: sugar transporter, partial [Paracoccaceae bacterium]|nr:sugar transporter [Paracoccaceae bacterium]